MSYASFEYNLHHDWNSTGRTSTQSPSQPAYVADDAARASRTRTLPAYDTAMAQADDDYHSAQNWAQNAAMAARGNKVASFVINDIPSYFQRIQTAMGNNDYETVGNLSDEMTAFANKHRNELQPWSALRNNGKIGSEYAARVMSVLDGSWQDAVGTGMKVNSRGEVVGGTSVRAFMSDRSPEAMSARAVNYAKNRGISEDLARQMTDPGAEFYKVFANDAKNYDALSANRGTVPGQLASTDQWARDKFDLVNRYRDQWASADEAASFFKTFENRLPTLTNGGRNVIDKAARAYFAQRDSGVSTSEFVDGFASLVSSLTPRPSVAVSRDGTQTYQTAPGSIDVDKAAGLAASALSVGSRLGLGADSILRDDSLRSLITENAKAMNALFADQGFDVYASSKHPNDDIVETAMHQMGVAGATDRLGFYRDGSAFLSSRIMTSRPYGLAQTVDKKGEGTVEPVRPNPAIERFEAPIRKTVSRMVSGYREGDESFAQTMDSVLADPDKRSSLRSELIQTVSSEGIRDRSLAGRVVDAYLGNLEGREDGAKQGVIDVLMDAAGLVQDRKTGAVMLPTARELQMQGLLLGQTMTGKDGNGKPVSVELSASDPRFLAGLAADPDRLMPRQQGESDETRKGFVEVAKALRDTSANRDRNIANASMKLVDELAPTGAQWNVDWARSRQGSGVDRKLAMLPETMDNVIRMAISVAASQRDGEAGRGAEASKAYYSRMGIPSVAGVQLSDHSAAGPKDLVLTPEGQKIHDILSRYGFYTDDTMSGSSLVHGFNFEAGMRYLMAQNPDAAKSPLFQVSTDKDFKFNFDTGRLLKYEQTRRLRSLSPEAESRPASEAVNPAQKEARRMLNSMIDEDRLDADVRARVNEYTTKNFPGSTEQALVTNRLMGEFKQTKGTHGAGYALAEMNKILSKSFRYLPMFDASGKVVPNHFKRSDDRMDDAEFKEWYESINRANSQNNILFRITDDMAREADARGMPAFAEAMKRAAGVEDFKLRSGIRLSDQLQYLSAKQEDL